MAQIRALPVMERIRYVKTASQDELRAITRMCDECVVPQSRDPAKAEA